MKLLHRPFISRTKQQKPNKIQEYTIIQSTLCKRL